MSLLVCLLWTLIDLTVSTNADPVVRLHVHPTHGFSTDNIEVRCQITTPSVYDNIYLSVRTDNVRPAGILLMVDNMINQCRINKEKFLHVTVCNSSLIIVQVNHVVLNNTVHTIDYSCSQGDEQVVSSYRILRKWRRPSSDIRTEPLFRSSQENNQRNTTIQDPATHPRP
jgi:hypothetical protein